MLQSLVDSKREYIEMLQDVIAIPVASKIYSMYVDSYKRGGLKQFQKELNSIPLWNNYIIEKERDKIEKESGCDFLDKLVKIAITTSVKIKTYEYRKKLKKYNPSIPSCVDFIHKCYINSAKFAWKNTYLFVQNNLRDAEIQNNLNVIETNIRKCVAKTVLEFVDMKEILSILENISDEKKRLKKSNVSRKNPQSNALVSKQETHQDSNSDSSSESDRNNDNASDVSGEVFGGNELLSSSANSTTSRDETREENIEAFVNNNDIGDTMENGLGEGNESDKSEEDDDRENQLVDKDTELGVVQSDSGDDSSEGSDKEEYQDMSVVSEGFDARREIDTECVGETSDVDYIIDEIGSENEIIDTKANVHYRSNESDESDASDSDRSDASDASDENMLSDDGSLSREPTGKNEDIKVVRLTTEKKTKKASFF